MSKRRAFSYDIGVNRYKNYKDSKNRCRCIYSTKIESYLAGCGGFRHHKPIMLQVFAGAAYVDIDGSVRIPASLISFDNNNFH